MSGKFTLEKKLDSIIEDYMKAQGIPGMAVGIVADNKPVITKGYGYRNIDTKEPVTENSLFHMASVSKTFVMTAIIQLCESGKLDLDEPVVNYLPYFKAKDERYRKLTVRHMLSHTTGITYVDDSLWGKIGPYDEGALEGYVKSLSELELMWDPGSRFYYNNTMYEVLGHLISKVSGRTFEDYIKENILKPLEMKKSTFLRSEVDMSLAVSPHILTSETEQNVAVSKVYPYNRMHAPSSTLHSNVVEMCNYGRAYLNKGAFNGKSIYGESSYDIMFKPVIDFIRNGRKNEMGLTWFMNDYKEHRIISHSGSDTGFNTKIAFIPDAGAFIVFLCNCDFTNVDSISNALLDIVLGYEPEQIKASVSRDLIKAMDCGGIAEAIKTFYALKADASGKYVIREADLSRLGGMYMAENKWEEAIGIFKLALEEYPASAGLYNELGECYLGKSDKSSALESYKKAYELERGDFIAKKTINELKGM